LSPGLSPSTAPGFSSLTALRVIALQFVSLDPCILQGCTQLQSLELELVHIINDAGGAALPSVVGGLQQLMELQLCDVTNWPVTAATYSGLTASSKLQRLDLNSFDMPPGIWLHVFPPGRQLPALQKLRVLHDDAERTFEHPPALALGSDDFSCLVNCCPGLQEVGIGVQPGAQLAGLASASGLTSLSVDLVDEESFTSLGALSRLVRLQALAVDVVGPFSPCSLLYLTTLTALTSLTIRTSPGQEAAGAEDLCMSLEQVCQISLGFLANHAACIIHGVKQPPHYKHPVSHHAVMHMLLSHMPGAVLLHCCLSANHFVQLLNFSCTGPAIS